VVVCGHVWVFLEVASPPDLRIFQILDPKAAVIGFFLISGYSIAASLQRSSKGFYRRRFLRIYPIYFFAIVTTHILSLVLGSGIQAPHETFIPEP
jgi:peptidoglycan/LPS O-acetylase OafA/YrhL